LTAASALASFTNGAKLLHQIEAPTFLENAFTAEFASGSKTTLQWNFAMPTDWDGGTITAQFYWIANSTSTNSVVWGIKGRAYSDNQPWDAAFGTAVETTDANNGGTGANTINISAVSAAVTIGGSPAGGCHMQIQVYRLGSGSDTLAVDAELFEVRLTYTRA